MSKVQKIVIVGGGTAGWMSAALLKKVIGNVVDIELVESEQIGTVGVGEATIPPIQHVNSVLGIDEAEFLRFTNGTIKLGIEFQNWRVSPTESPATAANNESYFHSFGSAGKSFAFCHFHHFWCRAQQLGMNSNLWDYDLNYLAAKAGKFAKINAPDPILNLAYAYHFDASLYGKYLRKISEKLGVMRTEGKIKAVQQNSENGPENGYVTAVELESGKQIEGDLFIDCSGFKGLLIQERLGTGYDDWSHWLPCDRALAVPSKRMENTLPYTRSIAHSAGWQWRIPLQHRNGNGLVFSSAHYTEEQAREILLSNLESEALDEPRLIRFKTGRRRKQWHRNVVAVGLSSGFLEPLESTSIHLIQSAITRLIHLFPHNGVHQANVDEYNKLSKLEFEQIRDFLILHYHVQERNDSQFWRDLRTMAVPDSLTQKINLFRESGTLMREQNDLFLESSWLQVLLGQGIMPQDYHPIADQSSEKQLQDMLSQVRTIKQDPIAKMPSHDAFLKQFCNN